MQSQSIAEVVFLYVKKEYRRTIGMFRTKVIDSEEE